MRKIQQQRVPSLKTQRPRMQPAYDYAHPENDGQAYRERLSDAIESADRGEVNRLFSSKHLCILDSGFPARHFVWLLEQGYLYKNAVYRVHCDAAYGWYNTSMAHLAVELACQDDSVPDRDGLLEWLYDHNAALDIHVGYRDSYEQSNDNDGPTTLVLSSPLDVALKHACYSGTYFAAIFLLKAGVDTDNLSYVAKRGLNTVLRPRRRACRSALIAMLGTRPRSPYYAMGRNVALIIARMVWERRYSRRWNLAPGAQKKKARHEDADVKRNE